MWPLLLLFIAFVILIVHLVAKGSGRNNQLNGISVDTSMDNAYRAIKEHSKYKFGNPNVSQTGLIKSIAVTDSIDGKSEGIVLTINIHEISESRCKIVVIAGNMHSMQKVNPSPYAKDIVDSLRKANYKIH